MKLRDLLKEEAISGDQYTRLKMSILQQLVTAVGRFESRKIELDNEASKNEELMKSRVSSIFNTLDSSSQALEPDERKRIKQELVKELVSKYEPETIDIVLEFGGLRRYK